jgi:hypothetical protein
MNRRHDIDALRVSAFALLILYHVGMFYVADWGWHVKSAYQAEWLQLPMQLSNQWRMALIFLISGVAMRLVWGKYPAGVLAARRCWRLLVPLVFGMAIVVAPQPYFEALNKGLIEPGFIDFMRRYLTFQPFPPDAWGGVEIITWTWNHLWYLPYLLLYTLVLIPLVSIARRSEVCHRAVNAVRRLRGIWLVLVPVLPLLVYGNFVFPRFPYISHTLIDDGYAHAMYFTVFLYGFLLGRNDGLWNELARLRRRTLLAAVLFFVAFMVQDNLVPDDAGPVASQLQLIIIYLNRWLWILTVLGWGHQLVNRPFRWLPYATEAVYPWYILHQTLIVVAGATLSPMALGPVIEPLLLLGCTIGGCFVLHEYLIRRTPLLRPLFGLPVRGKTSRKTDKGAVEPTQAARVPVSQ